MQFTRNSWQHSDENNSVAQRRVARGLLLLLILLAFGRVCWHLDAHNMWWDESLSLQRAEADWGTLVRGTLTMYDGFTAQPTIDQK